MLIAIDYRKVFVNDAEIILTRKEFDILCYLMVNRGRVLTYHQIFRRIWKEEYDEVSPQILWNVIKRLRKKIKAISGSTEYIENVREIGYRFAIEPDKLI